MAPGEKGEGETRTTTRTPIATTKEGGGSVFQLLPHQTGDKE
jgi:hypothetical protein